MMPIRCRTGTHTSLVLALALAMGAGCAGKGKNAAAVPTAAPVEEIQMEPVKLHAVKGPDGVQHVETFDATELFERGGAALAEKRFDDAITAYERLLKEFPNEAKYTKAAIYNEGLAYQGKKDFAAAIAKFQKLIDQFSWTSDAKDAQFQIGASYAEMGNWTTSAALFAQILERKDLSSDDKIEALARRGFAQFQLKDFEAAEKTFKSVVWFFQAIEKDERLQTDFFLALAKYHLAEIPHEQFRAAPLRLPEKKMLVDLEEKCRLLLVTQRAHIDAMKLGNPQWASASGYQVASLYEELYQALVHAPVPPELTTPENAEKLDVYYEELRKRIRVLLEKSLKWNEQNLLMIERLGIENEWKDKSKVAFANLQKMLDPTYKFEFADPSAPVPAATPAPPTPQAPDGRGGTGDADRERKDKPNPSPPIGRQIL